MNTLGVGADKKERGHRFIYILWPSGWVPEMSRPALPVELPAYAPVRGSHEGHLISWYTSGFQ